jgi:hypothetical protein
MKPYQMVITAIILSLLVGGFLFFRDGREFSGNFNLANLFGGNHAEGENPGQANAASKEGFSVQYPEGYNVVKNEEDGFKTIIAEKSSTEGFQIFSMPFDEEGPLTPERVLLDLDVEIENPEYILLGGVESLAFYGEGENLGGTYEIWAVHNGRLFQITTYKNFRTSLLEILRTWQFL